MLWFCIISACTGQPPAPKSITDIKLDGPWSKSHSGEDWVICDPSTSHDDNPMIILSTVNNLRLLAAASAWYGDDTYNTAP